MIEHLLDEHAQKSAISHISPRTKLLLGLGTLVITLIAGSILLPLIAAVSLSLVILCIARIPPGVYLRLLLIPAAFTLMSLLVILLLGGGGETLWEFSPSSALTLTITRESLSQAALIFSRVAGGVTSLLFISLTTPFTDIIRVLNQCRVPREITDLMAILYRNIFILLDQATQIHAAQVMRLGYSRPREATESFGMLCGSLFISSWNAGDDLLRAMDCRCYDGEFAQLTPSEPVRARSLLPVILYLSLLAGLALISATDMIPGAI